MRYVSTPVAAPRGQAAQLLLDLQRPRDVVLSADGTRVAYVVSPAYREKGQPLRSRLWAGAVDGEMAAVGDESASCALPRFSPDGSRIAFASDAGHAGRMSLHLDDLGEIGTVAGSVEEILWA